MNYFNKYRVVFWIMILMIVINISAFTSFYFYCHANRTTSTDTLVCSGTCKFLDEQLKLSPDQSAKVAVINKNFREQTEPVVAGIKSIRMSLLDELALEKPDTAKLNLFADKIGELQKTLQKAAILQYQQLKQICTPEQCLKLSAIYLEVYGCRKLGQGMGKGMNQQCPSAPGNEDCEKNQ